MVSTAVTGGFGRDYWRLLAASAAANLADGVGRVALPLLAATLTRDPVLVSALTALAFLPWLLFGLASGVLVDRVDRRRAMAVANLVRAALLGALAVSVLLGTAGIALLYAVAFGLGAAETVYDSAARAALPQLVPRDRIERGNSLLFTVEVVGQAFLGAPIGSLLFAVLAAAPLLGNATGFVLAAVLVLTMERSMRPARGERATVPAEIRDGLGWLWRHRLIRGITLLTALSAVAIYMMIAVQVLYALEVLGLPPAGYGLLLMVSGVGAVVGGLAVPRIAARFGRSASLVAASLLFALATIATGLTADPVTAGVLFGLTAVAATVWDVLSLSLRQALIPTGLFGRVQGAYRTLVWGAFPVGALAGGTLAAAAGVPAVFMVSGAAHLLVGIGVWRLVSAHRHEITFAFTAAGPAPSGTPPG
jgi:MFS family permease